MYRLICTPAYASIPDIIITIITFGFITNIIIIIQQLFTPVLV